MFRDPDFRKNLLISVVTSVLVLLFIEPILRWSGSVIMWFGANIYEGMSNSIYRNAALGFREESSFVTLIILVSLLTGFFSGAIKSMLGSGRRKTVAVESRNIYRKIILLVVVVGFIFDSLYIVAKDFATIQLNTTFNQRITILAAKVPDQKIKELRASWALMEKRADYDALTEELNKLANQLNVKLPTALPGA